MAFRQKHEDGRVVEYLEPSDLLRGLLEKESTAQYVVKDLASLLDKPVSDRALSPKTEPKKITVYRCSCVSDPKFFNRQKTGCQPKGYQLDEDDPRIRDND